MKAYTTFFTYLLFNIFILGILQFFYYAGWLELAFVNDTFHIVKIMIVLFSIGWLNAAYKAYWFSKELSNLDTSSTVKYYRKYVNKLDKNSPTRMILFSFLHNKLISRISSIRRLCTNLVLIGLIGTVAGFIFALGGIDPGAVSDVNKLPPMAFQMVGGMEIAFYTTLVGTVLSLWLSYCYQYAEKLAFLLFEKVIVKVDIVD